MVVLSTIFLRLAHFLRGKRAERRQARSSIQRRHQSAPVTSLFKLDNHNVYPSLMCLFAFVDRGACAVSWAFLVVCPQFLGERDLAV